MDFNLPGLRGNVNAFVPSVVTPLTSLGQKATNSSLGYEDIYDLSKAATSPTPAIASMTPSLNQSLKANVNNTAGNAFSNLLNSASGLANFGNPASSAISAATNFSKSLNPNGSSSSWGLKDWGTVAGIVGNVFDTYTGLASLMQNWQALDEYQKQFEFQEALAKKNVATNAQIYNNALANAKNVANALSGEQGQGLANLRAANDNYVQGQLISPDIYTTKKNSDYNIG